MKEKKYLNSYAVGILLGIVLLSSFLIIGGGLGASSTIQRAAVAIVKIVSPAHVDGNEYFAKYGEGNLNPLAYYLTFMSIGSLIGAFISGLINGRVRVETNRGPGISDKTRWLFAFIGGFLFIYGARLAQGCASGMILSGAPTLSVGAWVGAMGFFGGGFLVSYFVRKLWI